MSLPLVRVRWREVQLHRALLEQKESHRDHSDAQSKDGGVAHLSLLVKLSEVSFRNWHLVLSDELLALGRFAGDLNGLDKVSGNFSGAEHFVV